MNTLRNKLARMLASFSIAALLSMMLLPGLTLAANEFTVELTFEGNEEITFPEGNITNINLDLIFAGTFDEAVTVNYDFSASTATVNEDFVIRELNQLDAEADGVLDFTADNLNLELLQESIGVDINEDEEFEDDEAVIITLTAVSDGGQVLETNTVTINIANDDEEVPVEEEPIEEEPQPEEQPEEEPGPLDGIEPDFCSAFPEQTVSIIPGTAVYKEDAIRVQVTVPVSDLPEELTSRDDFHVAWVGMYTNRLNPDLNSTGQFLYSKLFGLEGLGEFSERPIPDGSIAEMRETWGQPQDTNGNDLSELDLEDSTFTINEDGDYVYEFVWTDLRDGTRFENRVESIVRYQIGDIETGELVDCHQGLIEDDLRYAILDFAKPEVVTVDQELLANVTDTATFVNTRAEEVEGLEAHRVVMALNYLQPGQSRGRFIIGDNNGRQDDGFGAEFTRFDFSELEEGIAILGWTPTDEYPNLADNDFAIHVTFEFDGRGYQTEYMPGGESFRVFAPTATVTPSAIAGQTPLKYTFAVPNGFGDITQVIFVNNYATREGSTGSGQFSASADPNCRPFVNGDEDNPNTWGNEFVEFLGCEITEGDEFTTFEFTLQPTADYPRVVNNFAYNVVYNIDNTQERAFTPDGQLAFETDDSSFIVIPADLDLLSVETEPAISYSGSELETVVEIKLDSLTEMLEEALGEEAVADVRVASATFNRGNQTIDERCHLVYKASEAEAFSIRTDWPHDDCTLNAEASSIEIVDGSAIVTFNWTAEAAFMATNMTTEGHAVVNFATENHGVLGISFPFVSALTEHHIYPTVQSELALAELPEGEATTLIVSLPEAFDQDVVLPLTVSGDAVLGVDYTLDQEVVDNVINVTIPAGETEFKIAITSGDDVLVEGNTDTIIFTATEVTSVDAEREVPNAAVNISETITIIDNDVAVNGGGGGGGNVGGGGRLLFDNDSGGSDDDIILTGQSANQLNALCEFADLDFAELAAEDAELSLAMQWACSYGMFKGDEGEDGKRYANIAKTMNRAEYAAVLTRIFTDRDCDAQAGRYELDYTDIDPAEWYAGCVAYGTAAGWFTGDTDLDGNRLLTFRPGDTISAAELMVAVARFVRLEVDGAYAENSDLLPAIFILAGREREWMADTIAFFYANDLANFEALQSVSTPLNRGEVCRLMYRLFQAGLLEV